MLMKDFSNYKYDLISKTNETLDDDTNTDDDTNDKVIKNEPTNGHLNYRITKPSFPGKETAADKNENVSFLNRICNLLSCSCCLITDDRDTKIKSSVTNEQYEDLKHAFIAFDLNADGFICSEDLGHVMKRLGHDLSVKETKKIFKEICTHDNGKLDFPDFVEMMAQDKLVLTTSEQELLAAFQFLDQNNDGYITVDELINKFHGCLSDSEASRLMSEADANGDGRIDFEEFKHMMFNNECGISLAQPTIEHYS